MTDLERFAADVGEEAPVTITGLGTRGGPVPGVRSVQPPAGVRWLQPDEMTACCGAGTAVDELQAALAEHGQTAALPAGGTVGGALSVGHSDVRRLGRGPVRDVLLQATFVNSAGQLVKAGGPTVKNVSGFDLPRLLVGARGTLGFLGEVIVRTRPIPPASQWYTAAATDPFPIFSQLYKPTSVLWNGERTWALLEGHPADLAQQADAAGLTATDGPPPLPMGSRRVLPPAQITEQSGEFVAEVGVGVVHHADPWTPPARDPRAREVAAALRREFDPSGRLNPGVDV